MAGTIHPSGTLFFRSFCGSAKVGAREYELDTTIDGNPCIRSETTGKYFVVSWKDLLEMAVAAGIDELEAPHGA